MPNGRRPAHAPQRRLRVCGSVDVTDTSVYGTPQGFRGHADPGDTFSLYSAWEYSITRNWVLALDAFYQHDSSTRVRGDTQGVPFSADSGSAWRFGLAPAIEYNFTSNIGVIFGARWFAAGSNTGASVTPSPRSTCFIEVAAATRPSPARYRSTPSTRASCRPRSE
jgi:hypothetical protein